MKNNGGFTLVELLTVLVIISLITVISVPLISEIEAKNETKIFVTKIDLLAQSYQIWATKNKDCLVKSNACGVGSCSSSGGSKYLCVASLSELANVGIIDYDTSENEIINPLTNEDISSLKIRLEYDQVRDIVEIYSLPYERVNKEINLIYD